MKMIFGLICSSLITVTAAVAGDKTPITLSIDAPHDVGNQGFLLTQDWRLTFRLEVKNAVAILANSNSSALVIEDPDNCIHMQSFFSDHSGPYEAGCLTEDESWFLYKDRSQCDSLQDDPYDPGNAFLNKPYLVVAPYPGIDDEPVLQGVGPDTSDDCMGYGAGLLPGLVVMGNVGAARIFDINFDRSESFPAIRNLAGFFKPVIEPLGKSNITTVRAEMVVKNHFEPIILIDGSIADQSTVSWFRLDSGPIEPIPYNPPLSPQANHVINQVTVRAVIVSGIGPDVITDMDNNGEYTAADLELMGYTLLSNQVQLDVVTKLTTFTEVGEDCRDPWPDYLPPNPFAYLSDLDGNSEAGAAACNLPGGARSGVRIRR
jgi:hypothetical protein